MSHGDMKPYNWGDHSADHSDRVCANCKRVWFTEIYPYDDKCPFCNSKDIEELDDIPANKK